MFICNETCWHYINSYFKKSGEGESEGISVLSYSLSLECSFKNSFQSTFFSWIASSQPNARAMGVLFQDLEGKRDNGNADVLYTMIIIY